MTLDVGFITCSRCRRQPAKPFKLKRNGGPKLPLDWKSYQGQPWCGECWRQGWVIRGITFPVDACLDHTWAEFQTALHECWRHATQAANWAVTQQALRDTPRTPGVEKQPRMARPNLYQEARVLFAGCLDSQSLGAILDQAWKKHRDPKTGRWHSLWLFDRALSTFVYPVPCPFPSKDWTARFATVTIQRRGQQGELLDREIEAPVVNVRFGTAGRFDLVLRTERRGRQVHQLRRLLAGEFKPCEAVLYRVRVGNGSHAGTTGRGNGGGKKFHYRVMVRLSVWMPRRPAREDRSGILFVSTGADCLWRAWTEDRADNPWIENADHIKRAIVAYDRQRQRLSEDSKHERRRPRREMQPILDRLEVLGRNQHNKLRDFCHQAADRIVGFARRHRLEKVVYDDSERGFFPSFPYSIICGCLQQKCEMETLTFEQVGSSGNEEDEGA